MPDLSQVSHKVATPTVWEVVGYDGLRENFRTQIPTGLITASKIQELLRILTAKHASLTDEEISASLMRSGTHRRQTHLDVRRTNEDSRGTTVCTCGDNPYFVAYVRHSP